MRLWEPLTGKEVRTFNPTVARARWPSPDATRVSQVAFSPDGKFLAAVKGYATVHLWDVATGKEVRSYGARCVAFAPNGRLLACGGGDEKGGIVRLYELPSGKEVHALRGHLTTVAAVTFAPDGATLISIGAVSVGLMTGREGQAETRYTRVWDVATGKEKYTFPSGPAAQALSLTPDGRTVIRWGNTITLWERATGAKRAELPGHLTAALSPDGRTLATGGTDGVIRLWDFPAGKERGRFVGHRGWVMVLAFAPDGKTLLSGGIDTTCLVLGRQPAADPPHEGSGVRGQQTR